MLHKRKKKLTSRRLTKIKEKCIMDKNTHPIPIMKIETVPIYDLMIYMILSVHTNTKTNNLLYRSQSQFKVLFEHLIYLFCFFFSILFKFYEIFVFLLLLLSF